MAPARVASFPDVPTFHEQGVKWEMWGWRGLALPRDVPADRKEKLLAALHRVIARDDYREFMRNSGFDARSAGPQEFAAELARLDREFGELLTSHTYRGVRDARSGPMVFPATIAGLLAAVLGLLYCTRGKRQRQTLLEAAVNSPKIDEEPSRPASLVSIALALVGVIALVVSMDWLGFVLAAFLFMAIFMRYLGTRLPVAIAASAICAAAAYQLFAVQMRVSLPWGLFGW
jgi:hypothetical protein